MDANLLAILSKQQTRREKPIQQKQKANRDVIERYDTPKGDLRKIRHSGPG